MNITRRAALKGTVEIRDSVLAARDEHERAHLAFDALPDTPEAEEAKNAQTTPICQAEVRIMQAEPTTLAGALAQVETLCQWDRDGLPQGAEEVIKRLVEVLPARIEGLRKTAETPTEQSPAHDDTPLLDQAAVKRLDELLCEAADINVALGRLFGADDLDDCLAAFKELNDAMDRRLARAIDLLATGDVEG